MKGEQIMDSYSTEPTPPKSSQEITERLGGKSFFKVCPNRHLHGFVRMNKVITYQHDSRHWGGTQRIGVNSFYCHKCGIRGYISND